MLGTGELEQRREQYLQANEKNFLFKIRDILDKYNMIRP